MASPVRAHVWISGRVQGVFFRMEARDRAQSRRIDGWAKNLPDGRVEAVFEGEKDNVESMIRWCHEGPSLALVESVEVAWEEPQDERGFHAR
ncbi:MAG: acylphosphatase [Acidimicrobiia bacterium]